MTCGATSYLFGLFIYAKVVYVEGIDFFLRHGASRHWPNQFYTILIGGFFNIFITTVAGIDQHLFGKKSRFFEIVKDRL